MKQLIIIALLIALYFYYKNNLTPEAKLKNEAEDKANAKEERLFKRKTEYAICEANSYGNPALSEGDKWNIYSACTSTVDAVYPKM